MVFFPEADFTLLYFYSFMELRIGPVKRLEYGEEKAINKKSDNGVSPVKKFQKSGP